MAGPRKGKSVAASTDVIDMASQQVIVSRPGESALGGGLEGADRTSRETMSWTPPIVSPDMQINGRKEMADARSRDSVQNDGLMMGALHTHRDSIVGANYRLICTPNFSVLGARFTEDWADEFAEHIEARFNLLADSTEHYFDASGDMTLTEMVRLAIGGKLMTGEVLATAEWLDGLRDRPFNTAIQMVSPTRLSNPDGGMDTTTLRRGVELDTHGRSIAYHIRSGHPGDFYMGQVWPLWKRIAARKPWGRRQVIHIAERLQPDQTRGIADMVSVLKEMRMTKKFKEITLQSAVVNATYAAAVESELPTEAIFQSMGAGGPGFGGMLREYMGALTEYVGSADNIAIDGVKMPHLFPGTKLSLKPAGTPGGVGTAFEESLLRNIAAPLGLNYEQFSKDYTKTNYSSARASMAETWKFMQSRKKIVADKFASMIFVLWLEEEIGYYADPLPLPAGVSRREFQKMFYNPVMREAICSAQWIGASRGQIDEVKETQAAIMRIGAGMSSLQAETARLGDDYRVVLRQQAREKKLKEKLGLDFSNDATKPGANDRQQTMSDNADDEDKQEKKDE